MKNKINDGYVKLLLPLLLVGLLPCHALEDAHFDANAFLAKALQKPAPASQKTELAPTTAAQWLELAKQTSLKTDSGTSARDLVAALPGPDTWDTIAAELEKRPLSDKPQIAARQLLLRLLIHQLNNNPEAAAADLAALEPLSRKAESKQYYDRLRYALALEAGDGQTILAFLQEQLKKNEWSSILVPDLVKLVGKDAARDFLKQALATPKLNLGFPYHPKNATFQLANEMALEMCAQLTVAPWDLVLSPDDPLFRALREKFPEATFSYRLAGYDCVSLILAGKTEKALKLASEATSDNIFSYSMREWLESAGHIPVILEFLHKCLSANPELPYWGAYIEMASAAGRNKEILPFVEKIVRREGLSDEARVKMLPLLVKTYLAADDIDKAVPALRQWMAASVKSSDESALRDSAEKAVTIGKLLDNKELAEEGLALLKQGANNVVESSSSWTSSYPWMSYAKALARVGRLDEAQEALAEALQIEIKNSREHYYSPPRPLLESMALYTQADRWADVRTLLDRAPCWSRDDIASIITDTAYIDDRSFYLGHMAALALTNAGRKEQALAIIDAFLDQKGGHDPAYALRLQLAPDTFLTRCDELFARDRFEERPLIWKAQRLLDLGRLDEAEKYAREAIAIDPTDGEQPAGDRLRAYAVLGKIRAAQGDQKEADFLKEVVYSVQRSEEADSLRSAGLHTRARKIYEESLEHFVDAYCIHARLAVRLAEEGDMAGAERHYQKAYELMPGSFGRVESYCFGCESAFGTPQAKGIAERVFTKIIAANPESPQNHYMLGYLRYEENRYEEALTSFRQAVTLDPDYLNAWKKMKECAEHLELLGAQHDEINRNILRLDPLGRHSNVQLNQWRNLREGWQAMEAAQQLRPQILATLYPLAASQSSEHARSRDERIGQQLLSRDWVQALCYGLNGWHCHN